MGVLQARAVWEPELCGCLSYMGVCLMSSCGLRMGVYLVASAPDQLRHPVVEHDVVVGRGSRVGVYFVPCGCLFCACFCTIQNGSGTTLFSTQTLEGKAMRLEANCNLVITNLSDSVLFQTMTLCN
jgi:hypothetical protein